MLIITEPNTPLNNAYHVGSFLFMEDIMELKSHQVPMSVEEQIINLKQLGLIIEDEERAKSFLNDVSYFRLIKTYCLGLKKKNGSFYNGVTFEKIVELYLFNANFRQALFAQIEKVEVNLRCRLSNYFSVKYGVLGYEDSKNFLSKKYHEQFMEDIKLEITRNKKAPFVRNFQTNYIDGKIPFYALTELMSFGTLSKFYKNMKSEDKKAVAKMYGAPYTYFESWIENVAFVRNVCAHYGRLYNAKIPKKPMLYKVYSHLGNDRIFSTLICLKHLLPNDRHWMDYLDLIEMLFEKYSNVNIALMGFANN